MRFSLREHRLTDAERLWLGETLRNDKFDPKIAKATLYRKLPDDFDPRDIDSRIYFNGRPTLIGLWLVDRENPIFDAIDKVISTIRSEILDKPGIESFAAVDLARLTGVSELLVSKALYEVSALSHFYSSAQGTGDSQAFASIQLTDEGSYDEYLRYKDVEDLLERWYVSRSPARMNHRVRTLFSSGFSAIDSRRGVPDDLTQQESYKPNTAFVLMAMNPDKPELEDTYAAIKDVCQKFEIDAFRADDIQHQDRITDRILSEIRTCEYIVADLTYERPNVYYEIGYAHAINKKPILYRRANTPLHFDLSIHNVPEYKNATELRTLLHKRLAAILGREPKAT
jgi:hypothetical protein